MSYAKMIEKLYEHEEESMRELEIILWSIEYLDIKRQSPNYKPPQYDETELLDWCEKFLKERKQK